MVIQSSISFGTSMVLRRRGGGCSRCYWCSCQQCALFFGTHLEHVANQQARVIVLESIRTGRRIGNVNYPAIAFLLEEATRHRRAWCNLCRVKQPTQSPIGL